MGCACGFGERHILPMLSTALSLGPLMVAAWLHHLQHVCGEIDFVKHHRCRASQRRWTTPLSP